MSYLSVPSKSFNCSSHFIMLFLRIIRLSFKRLLLSKIFEFVTSFIFKQFSHFYGSRGPVALITVELFSNNLYFSLNRFNSSLVLRSSFLRALSDLPFTLTFILTLFFIILALLANIKVEMVSTIYSLEGLTLAIIAVLLLPPSEFLSKKVNLESLYLICLYLPLDISAREFMTYPSTVKLLFILHPSLNRSFFVFVNFYLSEPARSTKLNFDIL